MNGLAMFAQAGAEMGTAYVNDLFRSNSLKQQRRGYIEDSNILARDMPAAKMYGYQRAGVNPFAEGASGLASDGAQMSQGQYGTAVAPNIAGLQQAAAQMSLVDSQTAKNVADAEQARSNSKVLQKQIEVLQKDLKVKEETAANIAAGTQKLQAEFDKVKEENKLLRQRQYTEFLTQNKLKADTSVSEAQVGFLGAQTEQAQESAYYTRAQRLHILPVQKKLIESETWLNDAQREVAYQTAKRIENEVKIGEMDVSLRFQTFAHDMDAALEESRARYNRAVADKMKQGMQVSVNSRRYDRDSRAARYFNLFLNLTGAMLEPFKGILSSGSSSSDVNVQSQSQSKTVVVHP